jgi:hypothetical protein
MEIGVSGLLFLPAQQLAEKDYKSNLAIATIRHRVLAVSSAKVLFRRSSFAMSKLLVLL